MVSLGSWLSVKALFAARPGGNQLVERPINRGRASVLLLRARYKVSTIKEVFMITKVTSGCFVLVLLVCAWSEGAAAQSCLKAPLPTSICDAQYTFWVGDTLLAGSRCLCGDGVPRLTAFCWVKTPKCAPIAECPKCNTASSPIDLATGDTYITQVDVKIPGLGGGLTLVRTWNSLSPELAIGSRTGLFGPYWLSNFEESVFAGSDGYVRYSRGDGGFWVFGFAGYSTNGPIYTPASPANKIATLTQGNSTWTLLFQNGEQRVFDNTTGFLLSITDRNGNVTALTYDSSYRLVTVTDAAARHLYFSYATPSSYLVTGVSSDVGVSLSYIYDTLGRLTQVVQPDKSTLSFQFSGPYSNLITAVLDSNGKVLESHSYFECTPPDEPAPGWYGRGVTSARAGGVEAVAVSYPYAGEACIIGSLP